MRVGFHVQGFSRGKPVAVQNALDRGAETIQIFASNPRQWRLPPVRREADSQLRREMRKQDVRPLFIHAPYLVNLASPNKTTRGRSHRVVEWTLQRAEELGARGVVVHAGSAVGGRAAAAVRRQAGAIKELLGESSRGCYYLVELTAGGAGELASNFEEAAQLLDACDGHLRVGICIDTCHLHAAGYDLRDEPGVSSMAGDLERQIGWRRLHLVHANDSRDSCGSHRDRHWHLGRGEIGAAGFRALLQHRRLQRVPVVCETPGQVEDDRRNLRFLKRIRDGR